MQQEQKQYEKNNSRVNVLEKHVDVIEDADLNEAKSKDNEKEVKNVGVSSRFLLFRERMRGLSLHRCPPKDRMRDKTVSYVDLLRTDPPPSRRNDETSRRFAKRK